MYNRPNANQVYNLLIRYLTDRPAETALAATARERKRVARARGRAVPAACLAVVRLIMLALNRLNTIGVFENAHVHCNLVLLQSMASERAGTTVFVAPHHPFNTIMPLHNLLTSLPPVAVEPPGESRAFGGHVGTRRSLELRRALR